MRFINLIVTLPDNLDLKFQEEIINHYFNPDDMVEYTEVQKGFINRMHVAMYGETVEERMERRAAEKTAAEKNMIIQNMILESDLSDEKIAKITGMPVETVKDIRENMGDLK